MRQLVNELVKDVNRFETETTHWTNFQKVEDAWPSWKHSGWDGGRVWNQIVSLLIFQTEHPVSLTGLTAGPNIFLFAKWLLTIVQTSEIIEGKAATGASYFEALEAMLRQLFPLCSSVSIPTAPNVRSILELSFSNFGWIRQAQNKNDLGPHQHVTQSLDPILLDALEINAVRPFGIPFWQTNWSKTEATSCAKGCNISTLSFRITSNACINNTSS